MDATDRAMQDVIDAHEAAYHPGRPCPEGERGACAARSADPDIWMTTEDIGDARWPTPPRRGRP